MALPVQNDRPWYESYFDAVTTNVGTLANVANTAIGGASTTAQAGFNAAGSAVGQVAAAAPAAAAAGAAAGASSFVLTGAAVLLGFYALKRFAK